MGDLRLQRMSGMFRYNKVINEYEFQPLEVLHYLLITLRLGRHFKGEFRLTKRGADLATAPAQLFAELIPFYLLQIDHASYARFDERPFGKWDVWMNVINVEADHGTTERALFAVFNGAEHDWDNAGWREMAAFSSCARLNGPDCLSKPVKSARANTCTTSSKRRCGAVQ